MCDDCTYIAREMGEEDGFREGVESLRPEVERLERELANVKRVAAKWMRKALG